MATLFVLLMFVSLACLGAGLIRPKLFSFLLKAKTSRKSVLVVFGALSAAFFLLAGVFPGATGAIVEPTDEERILGIAYQGAVSDMSLKFVDATVAMEELFKNAPTMTPEARKAALDSTILKWDEADTSIEQFSLVVDALPDYELSAIEQSPTFPFVSETAASDLDDAIKKLDEQEKDAEGSIKVSGKEREIGRQKILEMYDKAPPGQRLKVMAEFFGTDARVAKNELDRMRNLEAKIAVNQEEVLHGYEDAAQVTKTGAKVGVFIIGLVPAAGGSALALTGLAGVKLAAAGAGLVFTSIAGAGLVFEVSDTAVNVGLATEDGVAAKLAKAKEAKFFKQMSLVSGIMDPIRAIGQLQKLSDAAGGIKNLLTKEGAQNILKNKEAWEGLKTDTSGNILTIMDGGPKAWDIISGETELGLENIVVNFAGGGEGEVEVKTDEGETKMTDQLPLSEEMTKFIKDVYSEVQIIASKPLPTEAPTVTPGAEATPTPEATPKSIVRISKACSSGQLTVYTDCSSGTKVSKEWGPGKGRAALNADRTAFLVKISGGRGNYVFTAYLEDGTSIAVANYSGSTATLTSEASALGWTLSDSYAYVPGSR